MTCLIIYLYTDTLDVNFKFSLNCFLDKHCAELKLLIIHRNSVEIKHLKFIKIQTTRAKEQNWVALNFFLSIAEFDSFVLTGSFNDKTKVVFESQIPLSSVEVISIYFTEW